jgi:hypothetical protein
MALRKNIEFKGQSIIHSAMGLIDMGNETVELNVYIKISAIDGDKENINATVAFIYKQSHFNKSYAIPVSVDDGSNNFIKQAYEHLKTLPEFSGAEDC